MFDKQAVDAYRSLTAPASLREQVMMNATKQPTASVHYLKVISAVAACIVLVCICGSLWLSPAADVQVDVVPSSAMLSYTDASSRSSEPYAVVSLQADGAITIRSDDTFYIDEGDELTAVGKRYRAKDRLVLCWPVNAGSASFEANGVSYTLIADSETGNVTIVQD